MSFARIALLARHRTASLLACRNASTSVATHHENHHEDNYPKEGFGSPIWGFALLCSFLAVGAYKYAPEPTGDVYLTRWIAMYTSPRNLWLDLNAKHAALQQDISHGNLLLSDAKKARVHRYRYPQSFEKASPFLTPVGMDVDTTRFVVKGDKD
ncbi:hypothetical protein L208DRAFT_1409247 [Tricholoma matsutake]|nr:hypothetical protein L208DRAFT_1409247 [Tricholoma matsutake 945]